MGTKQKPDGLEARLNGVLINKYHGGENAAYPTICKGRYKAGEDTYYAIEEPASLNALELLPELHRIGIAAIKIEGRQRSPSYVGAVTRVWRNALDAYFASGAHRPRPEWTDTLREVSEGQSHTLGAYHRPWK
jgi:putative protease